MTFDEWYDADEQYTLRDEVGRYEAYQIWCAAYDEGHDEGQEKAWSRMDGGL